MPFSTSSIRTSLPNSLGLCALPLRMTSVCASNKLNTFFYPQPFAHHLQPFVPPSLHHLAGLSHHVPTQSQQLLVTVPHVLLVGLGQALGGTADLQQPMFDRACVIDNFHG